MKNEETFWDRLADKYFKEPIKDQDAYEKKLRLTQALFTPDTDVFEFACGTGGTALRHAPYVRSVHATDFSSEMIRIARAQADSLGVSNVTFEQADITRHDAGRERYDVVLGMSILHLLREPERVASRVHDWLKPGGSFVSSTVCLGDSMAWIRFIAPIGRALGKMPYVNVFKAAELRSFLLRAGFEIETEWRPEKSPAVFIIARKPG